MSGRGRALDVGCGCTGRFIDLLRQAGFQLTGIDVSREMIRLARARHPDVDFYRADICLWPIPERYDFISAWDSIWHLPPGQQGTVIRKLLDALNPGGVLVFSFGGTDTEDNHLNDAMAPRLAMRRWV